MHARRLCRIRTQSDTDETPFPLDDAGFLYSPSAVLGRRGGSSELSDPIELCRDYSFALLGEPGSGKSTVLQAIARRWRERLGSSSVTALDAIALTELRYQAKLAPIFDGLDTRRPSTASPAAVRHVVILDQVDECPILLQLPQLLRDSLEGREVSGLRLVFACRLMDYNRALDATLVDLLPYKATDLAPLTRTHATQIADLHGVDGRALVRTAIVRGVSPLASIPLTLEMLCEMYEENGDLQGAPSEIFESAVRRFAERSSPDMSDAGAALNSVGREQRLSVAKRIAVRLLLSGRRNIWTSGESDRRPSDLDLAGLVGGEEGDAEHRFSVSEGMIRQTLRCALFAAVGPNRIAFRHSSVAAFLAASYLVERQVSELQLRQLFLVEQSVGAPWVSIPTALRETAAWITALCPSRAGWLAEADPLSLAGHSALVDSPAARRTIVEALIRTAEDAYLSESWWRRRGSLRLKHPGLANQVERALDELSGSGWRSQARMQIVLELAADSEDPTLTPRMLDIANSDHWPTTVRRLAVNAVVACGPDLVCELKPLLASLADPDYARAIDSEDELRGALLSALWPKHMTTEELLSLLTPRQNPSLYGGYARFLRIDAAQNATDDDVVAILTLMAERTDGESEASESAAVSDVESSATAASPARRRSSGAQPEGDEFVAAIIDRGLSGPDAEQLIDPIAAIVEPYMREFQQLDIPDSLDETTSTRTPEKVATLRRHLAASLALRDFDADPAWAAHRILSGWRARFRGLVSADGSDTRRRALVDSRDFAWIADKARDIAVDHPTGAAVLAEIAVTILDTANETDYEYAYGLRTMVPFAGSSLRRIFDAVPIDSRVAEAWRADHKAPPPWEDAGEFAESVRQLLVDVTDEDPSRFWQLAWQLQFDPSTGRAQVPVMHDDLLAFPSVVVLGDGAENRLGKAAYCYLLRQHDHWTDWLGTNRYDKRAWAGYLALCILDRQDRAKLQTVPWSQWVGSLLWFLPGSDDAQRDRHRRLLRAAATAAAASFASATTQFVRRELGRGSLPYGLDALQGCMSAELGDAIGVLLTGIRDTLSGEPGTLTIPDTEEAASLAVQVYRDLASTALQTSVAGIVDKVIDAMIFTPGQFPNALACTSAVVLMNVTPMRAWPIIRDSVGTDQEAALPIAHALAHQNYYGPRLDAFTDDYLAQFYRWLATLTPNVGDGIHAGAYFASADEDTRRLRDRVLDSLAQRGTPRALTLLQSLASQTESIHLEAALHRARLQLAEINWKPPDPDDLAVLLGDPTRRLVRTDSELAALIIEALAAIEEELPSHGELLWDRIPAPVRTAAENAGLKLGYADMGNGDDLWAPKPEAALSAYLAHQLRLRLEQRSVIVNREVLVLPRTAYGTGDRTDVHVQVRDGETIHTVPIEIKGSWNSDVESALEDQLVDRYLAEVQSTAGVFLVGWYPPNLWTVKDPSRRPKARRWSVETLRTALEARVNDAYKSAGATVRQYVLTVPRPGAATR